MPLEMGLWRVDDKPVRLTAVGMPNEAQLEDLIEADSSILGERLLIIGRQVITSSGKIIDLLAVDSEGRLRVLELKRDKTPRDVVAQVLDYGSWVRGLDYAAVISIFDKYAKGTSQSFEAAFEQRFDSSPSDLNLEPILTVIASELDPATERIIEYLVSYSVPINAVFFRYYEDSGHRYLGRTWLLDQEQVIEKAAGTGSKSNEPWNGRDWYVSFGESSARTWEDALRYGFVSAGGGEWYERSIKKLPLEGRVWVYIPKVGYVGVGTVTGPPAPFNEAEFEVDGESQRLADLPHSGTYIHTDGEEWMVPVKWLDTRPLSKAVKGPGLFANQNSAARLRNRFTLEELAKAFDISDDHA